MSKPETTELLPCPFCGSAGRLDDDRPTKSFSVICTNPGKVERDGVLKNEWLCRCRAPWRVTTEDAIAAWNARGPNWTRERPSAAEVDLLTGCADDQSEVGMAIQQLNTRGEVVAGITIRHALKIMKLVALLREARNSRAADTVPHGWADRVDAALQEHQ